jgi:Fe-S oxidoreductase
VTQLRPLIDDPKVEAILFLEPSCLSAIKDDWLSLRCRSSLDLRKRLAAKAMLVEQFLHERWDRLPRRPDALAPPTTPAVLHAHCHQKALWGAASSGAVLQRLLGDRLSIPDTGCCGMAGAFGFAEGKFDLSMKIANLDGQGGPAGGIMPHVRAARAKSADAWIIAPGTSCRHQIKDASDGAVRALHPVEVIERLLG